MTSERNGESSRDSGGELVALLRQAAHDLRGAIGLSRGALQTLREGGEIDARLVTMAEKGVERVLLLADRYEWRATCISGSTSGSSSPIDAASLLETSKRRAERCFGRASLKISLDPVDPTLRIRNDGSALNAIFDEMFAFALRRAESTVTASATADDTTFVLKLTCDAHGVPDFTKPETSGDALALNVAFELAKRIGGSFVVSSEAKTTTLSFSCAKNG